MMKFLVVYLALALGFVALPAAAAQNGGAAKVDAPAAKGAAAEGLWLTASGNAVVRVASCGGDLCGRIVGLVLNPGDAIPKDWQGAPQCGLTIFRTAPSPDGAAWTGRILDPRDGSQYDARVSVAQPGRLQLRGYIGLPIFGQTQTWTPYHGAVPADCVMRRDMGVS